MASIGNIEDLGIKLDAISNITVTGNYGNDDSDIETAVNAIITALEKCGILTPN